LYLATREVGASSGTSELVAGSAASPDDGGRGEGDDVEFIAGDFVATTTDRRLTDVIDCTFHTRRSSAGNWTTRGYANSRTGQLAVSQMPPKRENKHTKSPMASASCPVRELSSNRSAA